MKGYMCVALPYNRMSEVPDAGTPVFFIMGRANVLKYGTIVRMHSGDWGVKLPNGKMRKPYLSSLIAVNSQLPNLKSKIVLESDRS